MRCVSSGPMEPRAAEIASVMARADMALLRTRPALVEGKYARMAGDPYSFFRGTLPLYLHDWQSGDSGTAESRYAGSAPLVLSLGDAHVENFGTLLAADGSFGVEPNDFDSADMTPYLWDVRRLATAMALASHLADAAREGARELSASRARDAALAMTTAYAKSIQALADGAAPARVSDPGDSLVLRNLFERSQKDLAERSELSDLTVIEHGRRRLRRGPIDPEDPTAELLDLPEACLDALPLSLDAYRATIPDPPPPPFFEILDAAREMGSGVASFPRVRLLLLVQGPSPSPDDDVILEVKELADAIGPGHSPPDVAFDSVQSRVRLTTRAAWATPGTAPLWGTSDMLGFPVQIRQVLGEQKTIRIRKLMDELGTPEAIAGLGAALGGILARVHASPVREGDPSPAVDIVSAMGGDLDGFAAEQAGTGAAGAERVLADYPLFVDALSELGSTLGIVPDAADTPTPELDALYNGVPSDR